MPYSPKYLQLQRIRWRAAVKDAHGLPPTWGALRAAVTAPIPDHAFLDIPDVSFPSPYVVTHYGIPDPKRKRRESGPRKLKKHPAWSLADTTSTPPTVPTVVAVDWNRFEATTPNDIFHGADVFKCKQCGTYIQGASLDEWRGAQFCPHRPTHRIPA